MEPEHGSLARLQDADGLVQHALKVRAVIVNRELQAPHVRLQEQERLRVRGIVALLEQVELQRALLRKLGVQLVLVVPHRELLVLRATAEQAHKRDESLPVATQGALEVRDAPVGEIVPRAAQKTIF